MEKDELNSAKKSVIIKPRLSLTLLSNEPLKIQGCFSIKWKDYFNFWLSHNELTVNGFFHRCLMNRAKILLNLASYAGCWQHGPFLCQYKHFHQYGRFAAWWWGGRREEEVGEETDRKLLHLMFQRVKIAKRDAMPGARRTTGDQWQCEWMIPPHEFPSRPGIPITYPIPGGIKTVLPASIGAVKL